MAAGAARASPAVKLGSRRQPPPGERTLLIRCLPRHFVARDLAALVAIHVRNECFDFVSVPWRRDNTRNMGVGFINFNELGAADDAAAALSGLQLHPHQDSRIEFATADIQGFAHNIDLYAESGMHREDLHIPLIFSNGVELLLHQVRRGLPSGDQHRVLHAAQFEPVGDSRVVSGAFQAAGAGARTNPCTKRGEQERGVHEAMAVASADVTSLLLELRRRGFF